MARYMNANIRKIAKELFGSIPVFCQPERERGILNMNKRSNGIQVKLELAKANQHA